MKKKLLSSFMAVCMILTMLPTAAFAAGAATISTTSTIVNGATGVTVTVTSDKAFDASTGISNDNWTIDAGTTGLTISSVELVSTDNANKTAKLTFTGNAAAGDLKIKAAVAAFLASESVDAVSNEITVTVPAAAPAAPTAAINYADEKITNVTTAEEYCIDTNATVTGSPTWTKFTDTTLDISSNIATTAQYIHIRTAAADPVPAGIVQDLAIPARTTAPTDASGVTVSKGTAAGTIGLSAANTLEYKITVSNGTAADATAKQDWTPGTGSAVNSTATDIVVGDKIWVRTAATNAAFASEAATASIEVVEGNIGAAEDKSAANVALAQTSINAGETVTLTVADAKDKDGTALTGEIAVTVTSDGTESTVFTGDVTFNNGAATISITGAKFTSVGTRDLAVTITGVTPANITFTSNALTVTPAAASKLIVKTEPTAPATNGAVLATQPAVEIQDQYGNVVTDATNVITAAATASQGWTLGGTETATAQAGVATFTNLTASNSGVSEVTGATIEFTSGQLTKATSGTFNIPADPETGDSTAPVLSSTTASAITATGATLNFTSDEAGTYYYLVLAAADAAPTAATIKAQGTAVAKGNGSAAASANTATVTGLTAETAYKAYVIVEDSAANISDVASIAITTIAAAEDTTAPVLSATSASAITATGATLNFTSDEAGTYYYLVLAAADAAPNATTIKAQGTAVAKGTDTATASANTATVTGLTAATAYKAYVIVEDSAANISDVASIAITTTAAPSPFSITEIGAASAGGVGMKRTITVDGPFTGAQYLVVQHTEGSGETAKVTATCIQLHEGTTTVEVSSQTTSVVRALITSGMPNLTGTGDFGVTVYADKTSS